MNSKEIISHTFPEVLDTLHPNVLAIIGLLATAYVPNSGFSVVRSLLNAYLPLMKPWTTT